MNQSSLSDRGSLLKKARDAQGWSQAELAHQLGTTQAQVSKWERGIAVPQPYYRQKLRQLLGKSAEELSFLPKQEEIQVQEVVQENHQTEQRNLLDGAQEQSQSRFPDVVP